MLTPYAGNRVCVTHLLGANADNTREAVTRKTVLFAESEIQTLNDRRIANDLAG
jgi:hypothetical protein